MQAPSAEELSCQAELLKNIVGKFRLKRETQGKAPKSEDHAFPNLEEETVKVNAKSQIDLNDDEFGKY